MSHHTTPTQNDKVLAALAHAFVLIPGWGMIGAIAIWLIRKEDSHFIAFQSLQAIIYQLIFVLFGLCMGLYTIVLFFYLLTPQTNQSAGRDFWPLLILGPSCCGWLFLLGYVGYGLWGAVSVLRGQSFHYWIIGSQLERRFPIQPNL